MPSKRARTPDEFWARVDRTGEGCWLWRLSVKGTKGVGYGQFWDSGRNRAAHQVAWEITNGPIPADANVLHQCDVRRCCRPAHLYLGTTKDNARDTVVRGRRKVKLTWEAACALRAAYTKGEGTVRGLARRFGVGKSVAHRVLKGTDRFLPPQS